MAGTAPDQQREDKQLPSFSEVYQKRFEGKQISPRQLIDSGEEFIVYRFEKLKSKFNKQDYAAVQIEFQGEKYFFNTSSSAILDQLQRTISKMPYKAKLVVKTGAEKQKYMKLE
jgi:hypothetical protein